jgi:hypothetical protein
MALERCAGVVMLPTLWLGLACCTQLHSLSITGNVYGGFVPWSAAPPSFAAFTGPDPPGMLAWQQHGGVPAAAPQQLTAAAAAYTSSPIPDCVALMRQLRRLDLSHNGLHALPAALGWCQQLSSVRLSGNQLQSVPLCVQALAGLRKLDLSANQVGERLGHAPWAFGLRCLLACCWPVAGLGSAGRLSSCWFEPAAAALSGDSLPLFQLEMQDPGAGALQPL